MYLPDRGSRLPDTNKYKQPTPHKVKRKQRRKYTHQCHTKDAVLPADVSVRLLSVSETVEISI